MAAALSWVGTPFCANAASKGRGVCCHRLVAEIYFEAGWLPRIDLPAGSPRWAQGSSRSLIEDWLDQDGKQWFQAGEASPQAGDLLGFRVGHCVHHLAIALPGGGLAHAIQGHGATILHELPAAWGKRLARIWRPRP